MTPADLKSAREKLGLSQAQLARLLGVQSDRTVRKWENGERDIPGPAVTLMTLFLRIPSLLKATKRIKLDI